MPLPNRPSSHSTTLPIAIQKFRSLPCTMQACKMLSCKRSVHVKGRLRKASIAGGDGKTKKLLNMFHSRAFYWRRGWESNPRKDYSFRGLANLRTRPLCDLSVYVYYCNDYTRAFPICQEFFYWFSQVCHRSSSIA